MKVIMWRWTRLRERRDDAGGVAQPVASENDDAVSGSCVGIRSD